LNFELPTSNAQRRSVRRVAGVAVQKAMMIQRTVVASVFCVTALTALVSCQMQPSGSPGPKGKTQLAKAIRPAARFIQLTGWGGGKPEEIVPLAAETGFDQIVVWNQDPDYLRALIAAGRKQGIGIYASLDLNDVRVWKARHSAATPPLQVMNDEENRALERLLSDPTPGKSRYQYGGEPVQPREVLIEEMLCFHHAGVADFFREQIKALASVEGLRGIAFDDFGYRNYHCCYCPRSTQLFEQYRRRHPEMAADKALDAFSLESLVSFNNSLAAYARQINPKLKILTHVYPVFLPEPLYGNRLDVDECGQTAAWFFEPFWDYKKIRRYSRVIFGEENAFFPRSKGVALIGIYAQPDKYSMKSPERVEEELQAILDGGGDRVQVCSMNDVLRHEPYRAVFKKFFAGHRSRPANDER